MQISLRKKKIWENKTRTIVWKIFFVIFNVKFVIVPHYNTAFYARDIQTTSFRRSVVYTRIKKIILIYDTLNICEPVYVKIKFLQSFPVPLTPTNKIIKRHNSSKASLTSTNEAAFRRSWRTFIFLSDFSSLKRSIFGALKTHTKFISFHFFCEF